MANQNWTPYNQANVVTNANNKPTETTKTQLWSLRDKVKSKVLPLTLAWAILVHWVSATDSQANSTDLQDKPGVTQVIDKSNQQKNQLKTEVQDKVAETEMITTILWKRNWQSYVDKYNSLNLELQAKVVSMYNEYKTHPKQIKLVGLYIKILSNINESAKFVMNYDSSKTYTTELPDNIWDEYDRLVSTDPSVVKYFDTPWKNTLYTIKNIQALDKTVLWIMTINQEKLNQKLAWAEQKLVWAEQKLVWAEQKLVWAEQKLVWAEQKLVW